MRSPRSRAISLHAALDRREHPQPQQVDLQKAGVGAGVLVPLHHLAALHGGRHHRAAVDQRPGGHDHPARVLGQVARQPVGLPRPARQPRPAPGTPLGAPGRWRCRRPRRSSTVAPGRSSWETSWCDEVLRAARHALDLAGGQAQHLAQLADRPARAVGGEGGHQRRCDRARSARARAGSASRGCRAGSRGRCRAARCSSSCRKRPSSSSLAIGSMCERPVRKQTIEDTEEPRPRPGGSSARAESGPRTSHGDLARQLEHVVVQQEEAGQPEPVDHPQLLLQARAGLAGGGPHLPRAGP